MSSDSEADNSFDRFFERGCERRDEERFDEALADFDKALALGQNDHERGVVWLMRGYIASLRDEREHARSCFREAVRLRPQQSLCSLSLFHAELALNDFASAVDEALRFSERKGCADYLEMFTDPDVLVLVGDENHANCMRIVRLQQAHEKKRSGDR